MRIVEKTENRYEETNLGLLEKRSKNTENTKMNKKIENIAIEIFQNPGIGGDSGCNMLGGSGGDL